MGKGDRRTKRGKINRASYGKNRKRKVKKKTKPAARVLATRVTGRRGRRRGPVVLLPDPPLEVRPQDR